MDELTEYAEPRDEHAERATLGAILRNGKVPVAVATIVGPTDFWNPAHVLLAETCWDLTARGITFDPVAARTEMLRRGTRPGHAAVDAVWLFGLLEAAGTDSAWHARRIRECAARRQLALTASRAAQLAQDPSTDPYDAAAQLVLHAEALAAQADPAEMPRLTDVLDFVQGDQSYDWLVPGLLERGDRLLITGNEGTGKSWWVRQLAVAVAAGIHPVSSVGIVPKRVLMVDFENGTRHLRRGTLRLVEYAASIRRPIAPDSMYIESIPSGVDVTRPDDQSWLMQLCAAARPDLLVIGPLYRMHAANMNDEEPARLLTQVLDRIRARHDCAVIVETHAPHAQGGAQRDLRPVGSSLFRRWPEFGMGIRPGKTDDTYDLASWRGARDEREWPQHLRRGSLTEWPWVEHNPNRDLRGHWSDDAEGESA